MKLSVFAGAFVLASLVSAQAQVAVRATTTLSELTSNNTSASNSFREDMGGNATPGNVSKLPLQTLLYPGATTKMYAHLMGWFGGPGHISVGYTSSDAAQIRKQVDDMVSRGLDGVIASWDTNAMIQQTIPLLLKEAERHPGFEFAIELEEFGFRNYAKTVDCDITEKMIADLTQAATQFESSPAYMRIAGRPVVFFFGVEKYYTDWKRVRAEVPGNPLFIFRNSGAFAKSYSDGGFSWSEKSKSDPYDEMTSYLDEFYKAALAAPNKVVHGSAYAGFNDSLATWGNNKIMHRNCGQTWLNSFARVGRFYSASKQLPALRLVTWNDYEEGTAIEPGVDNCVTVSAGLSNSSLQWWITGNGNTLDHISVYVSTDGENLMLLKDLAPSSRSLDLASVDLAKGSYIFYVRAVAKAGILNKMSGPVRYVPGNQPPRAALSVTNASGTAPLQVSASTTGSSDPDGSVASLSIDFGDGAVASGASAQHTYTKPGTYTVKAIVVDNSGVASVASREVVVNPVSPGVVISSPDQGATQASPVQVQASIASARAIQDMSVWIDGVRVFTTFSAQVDRKFQLKDGSHLIEVRATDNTGAVLRSTRTVVTRTPNLPPSASLSVTPFSGSGPNEVLACTAASSDPDDGISGYLIDFGDGIKASGVSLVHSYQSSGTYNVLATVTDSRGASSTSTQTVTVPNSGMGIPSGPPARFRLTATPQGNAVRPGDPATYTIQASALAANFNDEVALSCSGLPAGIACGFEPVRVRPGANGGTSRLVIGALQTTSVQPWMPFSALSLPLLGIVFLGGGRGRPKRSYLSLLPLGILAMALLVISSACGTGGSSTAGPQSGSTYNITVLGTSGASQSSTTVQYTMR